MASPPNPMRWPLARRSVLIGAGAAGALVVGLAVVPRRYGAPMVPGPQDHVIDALIRLGRDGTVTVAVPAAELGQGISTLAAQIVAMELGADWRRVGVEPALPSPVYADPVIAAEWAEAWLPGWLRLLPGAEAALAGSADDALVRWQAERLPVLMTAAGTTLAVFEPRLRAAAAALRAALVRAGAEAAGQPVDACDAVRHQVVCGKRRYGFAALIDRALGDPGRVAHLPPAPLRTAPPREPVDTAPGPLAAPAFPRLDLPAKVDGSMVFAGDVRLPGMVFAAIAHAPQGQCRLSAHNDAAAAHVPGLITTVAGHDWLAAVGQTWHAADRALALIDPRFHADGADARVADSTAIDAAMAAAARANSAHRIVAEGDPDPLFAAPAAKGTVASAVYEAAPVLHAPLETCSATARLANGMLDLWIASQAPEAAAEAAARAAGIARRQVNLYPLPAGGSFDARLDARIAGEVAAIARAVDRPVQLTWSRWQEMLAGFPRAPASCRIDAALDPAHSHLIGWRARITTPPAMIEQGARLFGGMAPAAAQAHAALAPDPLAVAGAMPVYAIPERAVDHVPVAISLPVARLRGGAHGFTAFAVESHIDECAHALGAEPLSFRIAMLGAEPRLAACLQGVAQLATWGGGAAGSGQGLACHRLVLNAPEGARTGHIAVIATVSAGAGGTRVDSLAAYCDIGRVINRDIARQQIEGGLIHGLALALGRPLRWTLGRPQAARLADLDLPGLAHCPKVDVAFATSEAEPFDPGELGMVAVAPAIGNALFSILGTRPRRLPFFAESLS